MFGGAARGQRPGGGSPFFEGTGRDLPGSHPVSANDAAVFPTRDTRFTNAATQRAAPAAGGNFDGGYVAR